jgi:hypothetical protein
MKWKVTVVITTPDTVTHDDIKKFVDGKMHSAGECHPSEVTRIAPVPTTPLTEAKALLEEQEASSGYSDDRRARALKICDAADSTPMRDATKTAVLSTIVKIATLLRGCADNDKDRRRCAFLRYKARYPLELLRARIKEDNECKWRAEHNRPTLGVGGIEIADVRRTWEIHDQRLIAKRLRETGK